MSKTGPNPKRSKEKGRSQSQRGKTAPVDHSAEAFRLELHEDEFMHFCSMLDEAPAPNPELERLFRTRAPWER